MYSLGFDCEWDSKEEIYEYTNLNEQDKFFCDELINSYIINKDLLQDDLKGLTINYSMERMFMVDKIILLLAMSEMKFFDDIPYLVTIKEAMEISKKYSSDDSVVFINGILGAYKQKLEKENG